MFDKFVSVLSSKERKDRFFSSYYTSSFRFFKPKIRLNMNFFRKNNIFSDAFSRKDDKSRSKNGPATVTIMLGETEVENGSSAEWEAGENELTITVSGGAPDTVYVVTVTKTEEETT